MQSVLSELESLAPKPIEVLQPSEARRQPTVADAVLQLRQEKGELNPEPIPPVGRVEMRAIPGPNGRIPVRVYTPAGQGPFPVIVYYHGGGWVLAAMDTYDASCRGLASGAGAVVVSVDYRRAPEHRFPAAHEDAYEALQHVIENAESFEGDPARVAVAGESSGGNLATGACLMAEKRGGRMPLHQLLIYPVTDYAFDSLSYKEHANAKPLNAAMMSWFFDQYLRSEADGDNVLVSPLRAAEEVMRELPPATILTAGIDPLRSEGGAYAARLHAAGVDVEVRDFPELTHEFFGLAAVVDQSKEAQRFAAERLTSAFKR